jgi:hypothetical protein
MTFASPCSLPLLGSLFLGAVLAGCGSQPAGPDTIPTTGKLVFTKGGSVKRIFDREGGIEFQSVEHPDVRGLGTINEDGSFTLATLKDGVAKEGLVPGTHRVRLNLDDTAQRLVAPHFLSFEKSGITVQVPSDQPIEVKVWK